MKLVVSNAFSVNMLPKKGFPVRVKFEHASLDKVKKLIKEALEESVPIESIVGHASTAEILTEILGIHIPPRRVSYELGSEDIMIVATISFRMEEGKVYSKEELEEIISSGKISFWIVRIDTKS